MFEKVHAKRVMGALHLLFVFIRDKPDDPMHREIIWLFHKHFSISMKRSNVRGFIRDIKLCKDHEYKSSLLNSLKKLDFNTGSFTLYRIEKSIPVLQSILQQLLKKMENKEYEKVRIMASAIHNYPMFLVQTYKCSSEEFWENHICYYSRIFEENFLNEWRFMFQDFYLKH